MEANKNNSQGINLFKHFVKNAKDDNPYFDYFELLDHISQEKIDKDLIAAIFHESIN